MQVPIGVVLCIPPFNYAGEEQLSPLLPRHAMEF